MFVNKLLGALGGICPRAPPLDPPLTISANPTEQKLQYVMASHHKGLPLQKSAPTKQN